MPFVHAEGLKPGMILEKDLLNAQAQLLMKAGTPLTERHIMLIPSWGFLEVAVKSLNEGGHPDPELPPELIQRAQHLLTPLFDRTEFSDPVIRELFHACVARKAKALHG